MFLPLVASLNLMMILIIEKFSLMKIVFFRSDPWIQREGDHLRTFDDDDNVLVNDDANILDLASLG